MLINLIGNPAQFIAYVTALIVAITIHEFAHAWTANKLGDPTARDMGRISFNPLAHLDFMGTIFLLLAGFGWGKPVQINADNLKNPKFDEVLISLAGPISNLLLAIVLGLLLRFISISPLISNFVIIIIIINLTLMVFNLLPIPPLDGSHILQIFISPQAYTTFSQIGIYILFGLIIFSNYFPIISMIINGTVNIFFHYIVGKVITLI